MKAKALAGGRIQVELTLREAESLTRGLFEFREALGEAKSYRQEKRDATQFEGIVGIATRQAIEKLKTDASWRVVEATRRQNMIAKAKYGYPKK